VGKGFSLNRCITPKKYTIGPSGVRALPLAAGRNLGGHYKWHFGPSGVRALPLAAGINVGGHYKWRFFLLLLSLSLLLFRLIANSPQRGCRRVLKFFMGS
jgi:hypothetical protein